MLTDKERDELVEFLEGCRPRCTLTHHDACDCQVIQRSLVALNRPDTVHRVPELRERFAAAAHASWSGWMEYLFGVCKSGPPGAHGRVMIPESAVERWTRQMTTPYAALPESEKESDRKEADRYLALLVSRSEACGPASRCEGVAALVAALAGWRDSGGADSTFWSRSASEGACPRCLRAVLPELAPPFGA